MSEPDWSRDPDAVIEKQQRAEAEVQTYASGLCGCPLPPPDHGRRPWRSVRLRPDGAAVMDARQIVLLQAISLDLRQRGDKAWAAADEVERGSAEFTSLRELSAAYHHAASLVTAGVRFSP